MIGRNDISSEQSICFVCPQIPGKLFSPGDKRKKKLSHPILVHLPFVTYIYPPRKALGGVYGPPREHIFHKGPPFEFSLS